MATGSVRIGAAALRCERGDPVHAGDDESEDRGERGEQVGLLRGIARSLEVAGRPPLVHLRGEVDGNASERPAAQDRHQDGVDEPVLGRRLRRGVLRRVLLWGAVLRLRRTVLRRLCILLGLRCGILWRLWCVLRGLRCVLRRRGRYRRDRSELPRRRRGRRGRLTGHDHRLAAIGARDRVVGVLGATPPTCSHRSPSATSTR